MFMIVDHPPQPCTEHGGRLNSNDRAKHETTETTTNTAVTRPNVQLYWASILARPKKARIMNTISHCCLCLFENSMVVSVLLNKT